MLGFKIAIPSYGRAATINTPLLIPRNYADYAVIVHTEAEAVWYRKNGLFLPSQVKVTGCAPGIARQRNWILENLVNPGEWVLMLDDNIAAFERVVDPLYNEEEIHMGRLPMKVWHNLFKRKIFFDALVPALLESIERAEAIGARLVGFASNDNPLFNKRKWRDVGLVVTKMALVKRTGLRFDENLTAKDDLGFTCENLKRVGKVLVNSFVRPVAAHYAEGGIGNQAVRAQASIRDAAYLVKKYPGLVRINGKRKPVGSEISLTMHSTAQVEKWRAKNDLLSVKIKS